MSGELEMRPEPGSLPFRYAPGVRPGPRRWTCEGCGIETLAPWLPCLACDGWEEAERFQEVTRRALLEWVTRKARRVAGELL